MVPRLSKKRKTPKAPQVRYLRCFYNLSVNTSYCRRLTCRLGRCFCIKMQRSPQETRNLYKRGIIQLNLFGAFQGLYRQSEPTKRHTLSVWMIDTVNSVPQSISLFTAILLSVKSIILFTNASPSPLPFSE